MRGYALIAVLIAALAMILSAGCFGDRQQSNDCTLSVNVQVTNNPGDMHIFTYTVELLTFTNTSTTTYVCDLSHTVCDHSHQATVCDQTCTNHHGCTVGSGHNRHTYQYGECMASHTETVCDQFHTVCDSGHNVVTWVNKTTVTNSQTVTSVQGSPTSVSVVYVTREHRYHLRWHDHFGDHDQPWDIDTSKEYIIRITDVNLDPSYGATQTQTFDTSICGGAVTFSYTGPAQTPTITPTPTPTPGGGGEGSGSEVGSGLGNGGGDSYDGSGYIFWDNTLCLVDTFQTYRFSAGNQTHIFVEVDNPAGTAVYYGETTGVNYTYGHRVTTLGNGTYYVWETGYWTVKLLGTDALDNPVIPRVLSSDKLWVNVAGPNGQPIAPPVERTKNYIVIT